MAGQLGIKTETTVGTAVTPDIFVPVLSSRVNIDEGYMRSDGIRAGRVTRTPARLGRRVVGGSVEMELYNGSVATLLKHAFGGVSTSGAGPYTHTYTPGSHLGDSFTLQLGIEDTAGTVQPFTFSGCKMDSWQLTAAVGELAKFSFDFTAKDVVTATALASASYSTLTPFSFVEATTVTVNGAAVASANAATYSCNKGFRNDRHVLGSRTIREQREQEKFEFMTEITADFDNLTLFALAVAATQVASVLTLSNGTESLAITSSGQVVGDPPSLESHGIEPQTIRLDHSHATADASAASAVLVDSEASAA